MASSPTPSSAPYVPFARRPDWADLAPVPQADPEDPALVAVPIDYPDEYRDATDYLRAVMAKGELSGRAMEAAAAVIELNAAHYTAWYYRRRCLEALVAAAKGADEEEEALYRQELDYTARVAAENPKNYQVWFHRQAVMGKFQDPAGELAYVAEALLEEDAKNYHVWAYRQWLLRTFQLWDGELDFVTVLLEADRRNNSAWTHRWFVVHTHELPHCKTPEAAAAVAGREAEYAWAYIERDPGNESPWNYLRGYLREAGYDWAKLGSPGLRERLMAMARTEAGQRCVPLQALLVEVHEREGEEGGLEEAAQIAETLGTELDPVRSRYWLHVVQARINARLLEGIASPAAASPAAQR